MERSAKVRNVAGILRGSDPALRDTFVLLTAHYDHLGVGFDGANDDGSGTVSVVEIAGALASLNPHPKRSILFMTFFGEERGLLGSRYYGRHPLVPVAKTIADLNLEQVGRTDSTEGPQIANASVTGFDFSDLPKILADAGKLNGIKVYKDDKASDPYFARSDNQALADLECPRTRSAWPSTIRITMAWATTGKRSISRTWPRWIEQSRPGLLHLPRMRRRPNGMNRILRRRNMWRPRRSCTETDSLTVAGLNRSEPRASASGSVSRLRPPETNIVAPLAGDRNSPARPETSGGACMARRRGFR